MAGETPGRPNFPTQSVEELRAHLNESPLNRIVLAVDYSDACKLLTLDRRLVEAVGAIKIGIGTEFHSPMSWPGIAAHLFRKGARGLYYDARFSETPAEMGERMGWFNERGAERVSVKEGIISLNVLAAADAALEAAVANRGRFALITETVQPSMSAGDCKRRHRRMPAEVVRDAAAIAVESGLQGLTSSAFELGGVAADPALSGLLRVATGVRSKGDDPGDQIRVATPAVARHMGAELLVIGHSIIGAPGNPYDKVMRIAEEIDKVAA